MCEMQQFGFHLILLILALKSSLTQTFNCYTDESTLLVNQSYVHCVCSGQDISLPYNSRRCTGIHFLTLKLYKVDFLTARDFETFDNESLIDLQLSEFWKLNDVEENTFNRFTQLRSLSISKAPALRKLSLQILQNDVHNYLRRFEITKTGLQEIPRVQRSRSFDTINLEGNLIQAIKKNSVQIDAEEMSVEYNRIEMVESWAFNRSRISRLSLKGNRNLRTLPEDTFHGLEGLKALDLSETSISRLPSSGLKELQLLRVTGTQTMKTIPSIYDFVNLIQAELTFSFHCCAFSLPERHDAQKYMAVKILIDSVRDICDEYYDTFDRSTFKSSQYEEEWFDNPVTPKTHNSISYDKLIEKNLPSSVPKNEVMKSKSFAICGSYRVRRAVVSCTPLPNAFNPCEDIMGHKWLRVSVWIVVLVGLMGNVCVLAVIACKLRDITVPNLLVLNLSFADLCMSVYLLRLAVEDLLSKDYYFNYAYDWQRGVGCKICGFLTIFSSQMSVFVLCFITVERWFGIKRALYLNRLNFRRTVYIIAGGWLYSLVMATLPLVGVSSYSATSLCLPMEVGTFVAKAYVLVLLTVAMLVFVIICVCYFQIYFSLSNETRHKDGEYVLARKMAILVGTNFVCWTPIAFFALTALFNYPLIDITNSKILLVFFYPLNSCANPFLYAILTTNFKRNFIFLMAKFGICRESARNYRLIYYQPKTVHGHRIHRPITSETTV